METVKKTTEIFKKLFGEKNNTVALILILGIFGMVLILLSEIFPENKPVSAEKTAFEKYESENLELEKQLQNIISKIEGAGKTELMLTFDSSKEYFYAGNYSKDWAEGESKSEEEIVIIDGENGETPIILKSTEAKIRGVFVVCEGGGNATVREKIVKAVCALLDIPSTRVSIAKMA